MHFIIASTLLYISCKKKAVVNIGNAYKWTVFQVRLLIKEFFKTD
jgi:hypothetical protein